jgi:hypothetical protein
MGIGNLVKETASIRTLHQPPFAFPALKEKHKYISASAIPRKCKKKKKKIFYFILFYFSSLSVRTGPVSARTRKKKTIFILFYFFRIHADR